MMTQLAFIAGGGALGALMRFAVANLAAQAFGRQFPYGTLIVNVVGSCLIGVLYVVLTERMLAGGNWRAFLIVGFLGAFTTFSTFSIETVLMLESGAPAKALLNVAMSIVLCFAGCWFGLTVARQL